ncbi:sigma-70 family RNA polymerase sigma factor [Micromonospora zingiberis]|uniref:RNA polymerase sigma factor n=1 Tax=Micromonospora zingiberis TaxID=2053011 RepID=A0A4R0GJT8_9ACTN|nr:sigma-70 family RNA polymerase sigma factor [Micromonospora zingiberis]TCB95641.1 sigma-70 family RNA polymerase sigma factor [Micromonospora zingiberis]
MTITANHAELVAAAQSGDRSAREELIAAHLPLLYNIVGRALHGHVDIDDVVQETLVRVIRDLPALRAPESFRSWLVAIALRQIATHRQRVRIAVDRATVVDTADLLPGDGDVEDEAILRLYLADQRRQVVEASRWLDVAQRPMLSLWWQECAGQLSRSEVAAACDTTVAHVGVRLQRMREQLELSRGIVAALAADPRCPGLTAAIDGWDGRPAPVWRKRIARHTRDCPTCSTRAEGQVPAERLLLGIAPLAVPAGLAAALAAKGLLTTTTVTTPVLAAAYTATGATTAAGGTPGTLLGKLAQLVSAHPVASVAAGAALAAGTVAGVALPPGPAPAPPAIVAAPTTAAPAPSSAAPTPSARTPSPEPSPARPSPSRPATAPGTIPLGSWSLESVEAAGRYLSHDGRYAELGQVGAASAERARERATFTVSRGLADPTCVTLRAADGRYLRHWGLQVQLSPDEGTPLFREDATFCPRRGSAAGSVTLQSHNYPSLVVHHRDGGFWLDLPDGSREFAAESSFVVRDPWA